MKHVFLSIGMVMLIVLLAACSAPAPQTTPPTAVAATAQPAVPTSQPAAPTIAATAQPAAPTSQPAAPTIAPTASAKPQPKVGGNLVIVYPNEPTTLDPHVSSTSGRELNQLGATLVSKDPKTGDYKPYLAESWTVSPDGLTYDFKLRKDVKFHDGMPLKAQDYAWTFQRAKDPKMKSPAASQAFGALASAEAVDDYTLRLKLAVPYYSFLESLELGFAQPLEKAAVEKWGDQYGRHPVGVGPFKFKEWVTGQRIVLERNPDYTWGPPFLTNKGTPYIQTIEFRYISEYATVVAGIEAGQIDFYDSLQPQDVTRLKASGKVQVFEAYMGGMRPYVSFNVSKPPFDDVKVRQAFNLAVDRDALLKVTFGGLGVPQYGPISFVTHGYWKGVESIGYKTNVAQAKSLMGEAGYKPGTDGMFAKDGQPFEVTLKVQSSDPFPKIAEVLQQQYKAAGISVKISQMDYGVLVGDAMKGNYEAAIGGFDYTEFDVVYIFFHSSGIGGLNISQLKDPQLDAALAATRTETDPVKRQAAADQAQKIIVEQAYVVPLFTPQVLLPISTRVKGVSLDTFSVTGNRFYAQDLWIEN